VALDSLAVAANKRTQEYFNPEYRWLQSLDEQN
jgi:hypothetical protein